MGRINAVFSTPAPVGFDRNTPSVDLAALIEKIGWEIVGQRRWVNVAYKHKNQPLGLLDRIRLNVQLADQIVVRIGQDRRQLSVFPVIGKAVIPAADRFLGVTFKLPRKRNPAVSTTTPPRAWRSRIQRAGRSVSNPTSSETGSAAPCSGQLPV